MSTQPEISNLEAGLDPSAPPLRIESQEFCVCCRCENTIRRQHVFSNIQRSNGLHPTRQTLRAWCLHCQTGFRLTRILRDNQWTIDGEVKIVEGPALAALKERVALADGDRQVGQSA